MKYWNILKYLIFFNILFILTVVAIVLLLL